MNKKYNLIVKIKNQIVLRAEDNRLNRIFINSLFEGEKYMIFVL